MTISARPPGFFADFRPLRILRLFSGAAALGALAVLPTAAEANTNQKANTNNKKKNKPNA